MNVMMMKGLGLLPVLAIIASVSSQTPSTLSLSLSRMNPFSFEYEAAQENDVFDPVVTRLL